MRTARPRFASLYLSLRYDRSGSVLGPLIVSSIWLKDLDLIINCEDRGRMETTLGFVVVAETLNLEIC